MFAHPHFVERAGRQVWASAVITPSRIIAHTARHPHGMKYYKRKKRKNKTTLVVQEAHGHALCECRATKYEKEKHAGLKRIGKKIQLAGQRKPAVRDRNMQVRVHAS